MKNASSPKGSYLLHQWMLHYGITNHVLAAALGISRRYLANLKSGKQKAGSSIAWGIEHVSKGAIPMDSWVPDDVRNYIKISSAKLRYSHQRTRIADRVRIREQILKATPKKFR